MSITRPATIVRLAHVVGDFGNPFYVDELKLDVWYVVSAVDCQSVSS